MSKRKARLPPQVPALSAAAKAAAAALSAPPTQQATGSSSRAVAKAGAPASDMGLLGRWLRMLLTAFYSDEETVIVDLLFQRAALVRDTVIAKLLGMDEKQVRRLLEQRLVVHCLVERETDGIGDQTRLFYRISPAMVAVAARRLQMLEDSLGTATCEKYKCPKCQRAYDTLEAMSLASHPNFGSSTFVCGDCQEELIAPTVEGGALEEERRHERLKRFRSQCRDLLLLTRQIQDMPVPRFTKEEDKMPAIRRARTTAATALAPATAAVPASGAESSEAVVSAQTGAHGAPRLRLCEETVRWFHQEILDSSELESLSELGRRQGKPDTEATEDDEAVRKMVADLWADLSEERLAQSLFARCPRTEARAALESVSSAASDRRAWVRGEEYLLAHIYENQDLQDRMTDEEYQHFADMGREVRPRVAASIYDC